jgi:hypothetical protein
MSASSAQADATGGSEGAGQAAFNPFGTIGIVVQTPAPAAPQPVEADWTLPVAAAVAGFALIGWLLRGMLQ